MHEVSVGEVPHVGTCLGSDPVLAWCGLRLEPIFPIWEARAGPGKALAEQRGKASAPDGFGAPA